MTMPFTFKNGSPRTTSWHKSFATTARTVREDQYPFLSESFNFTHSVNVAAVDSFGFGDSARLIGIGTGNSRRRSFRRSARLAWIRTISEPLSISAVNGTSSNVDGFRTAQFHKRCGTENGTENGTAGAMVLTESSESLDRLSL